MINDYKKVLTEYFTEFSIELDVIDIVETSDVENAYLKLRPDQTGKEQLDSRQYNGFAVAPMDRNGRFTILLNAHRMLLSKQRGNFDWVGTVVHEATHIDDHIKYGKIISVENYDDLYDHTKHNMFCCWTEFHARSMGHCYVYKYKKLFKLLIDREMKGKDLAAKAGISTATLAKMKKDGATVSSDVLVKICTALECTLDDIVEIIPVND
jgi:DNA-binding Xre family transcriptional regulator